MSSGVNGIHGGLLLAQPGSAAGSTEAGEDFARILKTQVEEVNQAQLDALHLAGEFEQGNPEVSLQQVMLSMQKANLSFQTMVQVRNKLVSAYQDIMNMQL